MRIWEQDEMIGEAELIDFRYCCDASRAVLSHSAPIDGSMAVSPFS